MTKVLVQPPDCQLSLSCEQHLDRGCLDALQEPSEGKRPPNTGARLWGRVRSKLLRQKVLGVSLCLSPPFPFLSLEGGMCWAG